MGVMQAAELVPYDSAIFISTATIPPHTDLVQDAAITLLKKRIRVSRGTDRETERGKSTVTNPNLTLKYLNYIAALYAVVWRACGQ